MALAVVGGEPGIGRALAREVAALGTRVVTIGAGPPAAGDAGHLPCDPSVADELHDCFGAAEAALGEIPALLRLGFRSEQAVAGELAELSLDDWMSRAEVPLREALAFHQAARRFLAGRGGRVLVVVPTVGLSGGPGFVPWAAAAEADRALVKAQARVSGDTGTTVNCIAVASAALAGANGADPDRSGLPPAALPPPDLAQQAAVVIALLGVGFAGVTGQTVAVDGGRWMAP